MFLVKLRGNDCLHQSRLRRGKGSSRGKQALSWHPQKKHSFKKGNTLLNTETNTPTLDLDLEVAEPAIPQDNVTHAKSGDCQPEILPVSQEVDGRIQLFPQKSAKNLRSRRGKEGIMVIGKVATTKVQRTQQRKASQSKLKRDWCYIRKPNQLLKKEWTMRVVVGKLNLNLK